MIQFAPRWLASTVLLCLAVPVFAQSAPIDSAPQMLVPGDVARILVWQHPELSGDFIVASDSSVSHPLMRQVKLGGIPLSTAESRLREFLMRFDTEPSFVFTPLQRVFVGGEVRQPNVYTVPPGTTVAQAVALAGGPTERGALRKVVLRRSQRGHTLDLSAATSPDAEIGVRSGDQLLVPRQRNFLTDVLAPSASLFAALAASVSIAIQLSRKPQ